MVGKSYVLRKGGGGWVFQEDVTKKYSMIQNKWKVW